MGSSLSTRLISGNGLSAGDMSKILNLNAQTAFNGNIVRAGVNYHFNFASAPVVTKF